MERGINKYYVPHLEEFHVGFEYEFKDWFTKEGVDASTGKEGSDYQKAIIQEDTFISTERREQLMKGKFGTDYQHGYDCILYYIKHNQIRVKYLDKEDIESLGWKYEKTHAGMSESFYTMTHPKDKDNKYDRIGLDHDTESNYLRIYFYNVGGDNTFFSGTIKNKSELRKVMQMLGIAFQN